MSTTDVHQFLAQIPPAIINLSQNADYQIADQNSPAKACADLLSKTLLLDGKRLRPLLTYLMSDYLNISLEKVKDIAHSAELVHAASLSHDDVIDEAATRRGKPSINVVSSNKKAVLAGDYLLSRVIVDLCKLGNLDIVSAMSSVISDLAMGEWLQLDLINDRLLYNRESIRDVALKKTSSVMGFCTEAPAIINNFSKTRREHARQFGQHLGVVFQFIDDTLDFSDFSGKEVCIDIKNNQLNVVTFLALEANPELKMRFDDGALLAEIFPSHFNFEPWIKAAFEWASREAELAMTHLNALNLTKNEAYNRLEMVLFYALHRSH